MIPAPDISHGLRPTPEWVSEIATLGLVDRTRAMMALTAFLTDNPGGEQDGFLDYAVRDGWLTRFQADRIREGESHRIAVGPYLLRSVLGPGTLGTTHTAGRKGDSRSFTVLVLPLRSIWNAHLARKQLDLIASLPEHPGIVPLEDIDTANGQHYLAWPHTEGETLECRVVRGGALPPATAVRLAAALAEILAICHRRGVTHGTLRPAVVQFRPDHSPRLLELGIGSVLAENIISEDSFLDTISTATAASLTIDCCAPETSQDPTQRTPAADQYGLGCLLYFALTGSYPFPDGSVVDKMIAHATQAPDSLTERNPDIPGEVSDIVARLLRKAPGERYPDMAAAAGALAGAVASCPTPSAAMAAPTRPESVACPLPIPETAGPQFPADGPNEEHDPTEAVTFDLPPAEVEPAADRSRHRLRFAPKPESPIPLANTPERTTVPDVKPIILKGRPGSLEDTPQPVSNGESDDADFSIDLPDPVAWSNQRSALPDEKPPAPVSIPAPPRAPALFRKLTRAVRFWKSATEVVRLSLFGPVRLIPGQSSRLQVYCHPDSAAAPVRTMARAFSPDFELLGSGTLDRDIPWGTKVRLHLTIQNVGIAEPVFQLTWSGQTLAYTFDAFVPWESPAGMSTARLDVEIDGTSTAAIPAAVAIASRHP